MKAKETTRVKYLLTTAILNMVNDGYNAEYVFQKLGTTARELVELGIDFGATENKEDPSPSNDVLNKEISRIDVLLLEKYLMNHIDTNNSVVFCPADNSALFWLTNDVESILLHEYKLNGKESSDKVLDDIVNILNESKYANNIVTKLDIEKVKKNVAIRSDFAAALRGVKSGTDLSSPLNFALSNNDIIALAKLHKANRFRKKIEDLLEDCNFHYECGCFIDRNYDKWLKV